MPLKRMRVVMVAAEDMPFENPRRGSSRANVVMEGKRDLMRRRSLFTRSALSHRVTHFLNSIRSR